MDATYSPGQLQTEMDMFAGWCMQNYLDLNSFKTKKIVDFHKAWKGQVIQITSGQ